MKTRIVYKVVLKTRRGGLVSPSKWSLPKGIAVTYVPGRKAVPCIGKLFAFRSERDAVAYCADGTPGQIIFKSRAEGVGQASECVPILNINRRALRRFWSGGMRVLEFPSGFSSEPPKGTVLCSSITLLERCQP